MDNQNQQSTSFFKLRNNVKNKGLVIQGELLFVRNHGQPSGSAKSSSVQIFSATELDPKTGSGILSEQTYLGCGKTSFCNGEKITTHPVEFRVNPGFGIPGAISVKNYCKLRFFLRSASLKTPDNKTIQFNCNSWVYPVTNTGSERSFFSNTKYLPNQTPEALSKLRKEELRSLRGNGQEERQEWDRIYDYDIYNDLGNPNPGAQYLRPILGGTEMHPYPRRLRTGHAPNKEENSLTMRDRKLGVPPDEQFSSKKMSEFQSNLDQAAMYCLHEIESVILEKSEDFKSFDEIHHKFSGNRSEFKAEGHLNEKFKNLLPCWLFGEAADMRKKNPFKFPRPHIIKDNEWTWKSDEEFARQMLAGTNPARIKSLEVFPPVSETGFESIIKQSDIEHNLDGMSLAQAMNQWRIFILDHHDYLMPFLEIINSKDFCIYASRTLLFLRSDNTLKPIAIELSLPISSTDFSEKEISRVYIPATKDQDGALWQLAKAHVMANDSVYHQLVSHWLQTHAVVEPFIIATSRQLSVMHPIHWLLHPHFKDTLHTNALARTILINQEGVFEKTLFSAEISMDLSAELYREWRFDEQALPADLLKRGMAIEDRDPNNPTGVKLLFQDYPYGADGLEIWAAIKTWVTDFCKLFYADDDCVASDGEVQAWWSEIRYIGHGDKRDETWWYDLTTLSNLIEALTTLIWIASALHASVNFGQYDYYGYPLNRTTQCRRFVPWEGTFPFAEFLKNPEEYFLKMLPGRFETSLNVALMAVLSHHSSDEEYLGQRSALAWTDNEEVRQRFEKFKKTLVEIEKRIAARNANPNLKNRRGPSGIPYQLLCPETSQVESRGGITGKGIPNSISI